VVVVDEVVVVDVVGLVVGVVDGVDEIVDITPWILSTNCL